MTLPAKILVSLVLTTMALLTLAMGRANVENFERIGESVEGIYADRLVVKGLIFDLSEIVHRKELELLKQNGDFFVNEAPSLNAQTETLLSTFRTTTLTERESEVLDRFTDSAARLSKQEQTLSLGGPEGREVLFRHLSEMKQDLRELSTIQLSEGRRKLRTGDNAIRSMNRNTWIERIMVLVALAATVAIVFVVPLPRTP